MPTDKEESAKTPIEPSPDQSQEKPESIWDNGKWVEMSAEALRRGIAEDQARRVGKLVKISRG